MQELEGGASGLLFQAALGEVRRALVALDPTPSALWGAACLRAVCPRALYTH